MAPEVKSQALDVRNCKRYVASQTPALGGMKAPRLPVLAVVLSPWGEHATETDTLLLLAAHHSEEGGKRRDDNQRHSDGNSPNGPRPRGVCWEIAERRGLKLKQNNKVKWKSPSPSTLF